LPQRGACPALIGALSLASSFRYPLGAVLPSRRWSAAAADYGLRQTHAFRLSSSPLPSYVCVVCLCTLPSDPSANPGCGLSTILSCRRPARPHTPDAMAACRSPCVPDKPVTIQPTTLDPRPSTKPNVLPGQPKQHAAAVTSLLNTHCNTAITYRVQSRAAQ
jgi:hypothetical protein